MKITEGSLGEWKYQHEHHRGSGGRIIWRNAPPSGAVLLAMFDDLVTVDGIGMAGMVTCTRQSDGFQMAVMPWDLKVPNVKPDERDSSAGRPVVPRRSDGQRQTTTEERG